MYFSPLSTTSYYALPLGTSDFSTGSIKKWDIPLLTTAVCNMDGVTTKGGLN